MTRVHLANNILVHIIMLLFKSHPVYRQLKKLVKTLINMVRHFPVLHFQVVHFQSPPTQADIAPSALETIIFHCFMDYISALTYYLLGLLLIELNCSSWRTPV